MTKEQAMSTMYQDYRLEQARKLFAALHSVIALAAEAHSAWDQDNDMRVGKILRFLSDPSARGYRKDIDVIHDTLKAAETYLGGSEQL